MRPTMNAHGDLGGSFELRLVCIRWRVLRRWCNRPGEKKKKKIGENTWGAVHGNLRSCAIKAKQWVRKQIQPNEVLIEEKTCELEKLQTEANISTLE
jgi:hypothetical protein